MKRSPQVPAPPPCPCAAIDTIQAKPVSTCSADRPLQATHGEEEKWGDNLWNLMRLCNVTAVEELPKIWRMIVPLSCDTARAATEAA